MNKKMKLDAYKHEKIEVYGDYIEEYKDESPEDLAENILMNLDIVFYQIENVQINPYKNSSPHIIIEYTVEL